MSQYNGIIARNDYEIAAQLFQDAGFSLKEIRLVSGDLRMEQPLAVGQNQYTFPVLVNIQNQAAPFPTEIRLQQQDSFCVSQIGIFIAKTTGHDDCSFLPATYLNPAVFTNATAMLPLYNNAIMKLMIDNDQYEKSWGVLRHWHSPETQQTAAAGAGSPIDEADYLEDGFVPCQPFFILTGAQDIQLSITMNIISPTAIDANSRYVIILRGYNAVKSTVIK